MSFNVIANGRVYAGPFATLSEAEASRVHHVAMCGAGAFVVDTGCVCDRCNGLTRYPSEHCRMVVAAPLCSHRYVNGTFCMVAAPCEWHAKPVWNDPISRAARAELARRAV